MGGGVDNVTPQLLYPWQWPDTCCIGSWVGPRADLDGCRKSMLLACLQIHYPKVPQIRAVVNCLTYLEFDCWLKWSTLYCVQCNQKSWRLCLIKQNDHFAHPGKLAGCIVCSAWWDNHICLSHMSGLKGPEMPSMRFYFMKLLNTE